MDLYRFCFVNLQTTSRISLSANELYPGDADAVLHLHDQAVLVCGDVENNPVVATKACMAKLLLDVLGGASWL